MDLSVHSLLILFAFIFVLLIIIIFRKIFIAKSTLSKTSAKKNIIKKPDSKARTNDTLRSELKKYEIFTLGTSGSGKTCFLASMFNSLVVYKKEYGFSLKVPDRQQEKKLIDIYIAQ